MDAVRTIAHGVENVRKKNNSYDRNSKIGRDKIKVSSSLIMECPRNFCYALFSANERETVTFLRIYNQKTNVSLRFSDI